MKIAIASDLHMEFSLCKIHNKENADVLVLAGDILVAEYFKKKEGERHDLAQQWKEWMKSVCSEFTHVVYVMGNHEHYMGCFDNTKNVLFENLHSDNLYFVDKGGYVIDGVTFVGGTLWTDINKRCPLTENVIRGSMNDYKEIFYKSKGRLFNTMDSLKEHMDTLEVVKWTVTGQEKIVVVTHHAPSRQSISPHYKDSHYMNGAYASSLEEIMYTFPQIKLWVHGHIHDPVDYIINETRVVSNPRGYSSNAEEFELKYFDI